MPCHYPSCPSCYHSTLVSLNTRSRSSNKAHMYSKICFVLVDGSLQNNNIISQEAINFLTKCTWAKAPDIFTPNKLCPTSAPSCLDFAQVTMPMVHPTTGETISRYKRLIHNPATAETWQMAFGKEFGGMAQGDNKTGQKGVNSIFIMTQNKIRNIASNQTVTYA
jgi:hypothetical protein